MDCKFVAKPAEDVVVKLYWGVRVYETLSSDEWVWSKCWNHAHKPFFFLNQSSILYTSLYTCQSQLPNSAHHHPHPTAVFPPWCPYVCSLYLCLNFCPATWFICTISLDSTYKWYHMIFVFLLLTSLSMTISRSIHHFYFK